MVPYVLGYRETREIESVSHLVDFLENNWNFYFSRGYKFQTNFSVGTT